RWSSGVDRHSRRCGFDGVVRLLQPEPRLFAHELDRFDEIASPNGLEHVLRKRIGRIAHRPRDGTSTATPAPVRSNGPALRRAGCCEPPRPRPFPEAAW